MDALSKKQCKDDGIFVSFVDEPASEQVTGSCVYIKTPKHNICIDYGLAQGSNDKYEDFLVNNRKTKEFKAKDIDLIFISHLHSDHINLTPKLYRDGCNGAVIVPNGNKGVAKIMMNDCCFINERDILLINSQHDKNYKPLYEEANVKTTLDHMIEKPIGEKIFIDDEISFKFVPSGHLLNGCQIILFITINGLTKTIGYSGDIGNNQLDNYYVGKRENIDKCDLFIGEATYGDRPELKTGVKERKNDLDKLKSIIDTQVKEMAGRVIIPSFAQSRCQQLVNMIYQLYQDSDWQPRVYVDSPLSIAIFKEYAQICEGRDKEAIDKVMQWDKLTFVKETKDSMALVESEEPCVIISSSGMCKIGRIRQHLKKAIPNVNATVLFVGFSTPGSLASLLKDNNRKSVTIDFQEYKCRCSSFSLKSMSGHAPFKQLVDYYSSINCNKIILHHGSKEAKEMLAKTLKQELEKNCKTTRVVCANSSLKFNL